MGASKHFFHNKDVDKKIKAQIYVTGPLNALLWELTVFHHSAIRRILGIKWSQVREKHIKHKEVRGILCNLPDIEAFIFKRTAVYLGKVSRSSSNTYPKNSLQHG